MKILPAVIFVVSASFLGSTQSYGQSYSTVAWGSVQAGQDEAIAVNKTVSGQIYQRRAPVNAQQNVSTTFVANKSRTRTNLQSFVNKSRAADPAGAAQLEQLISSQDIMGQIDTAMRTIGLRADNLADAYALWWVSLWKAANADTSVASGEVYRAVSAQAAQGFISNEAFAKMNDAQKQEMAEELLMQSALADAAAANYANDPTTMAKLSVAVRQGATKSGLDLDAMTLTEDGFVPAKGRKRSDASDVVGEGEEKALAANDVGYDKDIGLSATQLALIAAAGGAGLAGVFLFGKAMGKKG